MAAAERFEHYEVLKREDGSLWELGRGAMGVTYKAFDTDLHCQVALKVINPDILGSEGTEQRFLREARAAAQLRHPNIATVLRLGKTAETHFYAMEFCDGPTLQQVVEEHGPLTLAVALNATRQVANALVVAEEHQLVHRDIKPANLIFCQRRGEGLVIKVIDFGLAKSWGVAGTAWNSMTLATAGFLGTAHFSSPEQLEEGEVDVRSDIYSLGATLWFMLTGRPMFSGTIARVMTQHLFAPPPFEQLEALQLPPALRALLTRMLEKDPAARQQSASELKREIELCLAPAGDEAAATALASLHSLPAGPGTVLNGRWKLLEERGGRIRRRLFRGIDLKEKGRPVAVKMLDRATGEDPAQWSRWEKAAAVLKEPAPGLIRVLALQRDESERPFAVLEWIDGFTLLSLLQRRGALTLRETLRLLAQFAAAFDHAKNHGLDPVEWEKNQILIGFDGEAPAIGRLESLSQKPLTEWPEFRVVASALPRDNEQTADASIASMQTILPHRDSRPADDPPSARDGGVAGLGWLVFELLGGHHGSAGEGQRYVPSARLSAKGNAVLQRAVSPAVNDLPFQSGQEFFEALRATADFEVAWKPQPPAPRSIASPAQPAGAFRRRPLLFAALGVGLAVGAVLAVVLRKPAPVATAEQPVAQVSETAVATPGPKDLAPPSPLPGIVELTQHSPKGTMRVEHRNELAHGKGRSIWLISAADPHKRARLYSHLRTAAVLFSPDENWLVINDHSDSDSGGAQLYRRTKPGEVTYEIPVDMDCARERIEDLAWRYYAREVLPGGSAAREHVLIDAVEWQPDSSAFTLRFTASESRGEETVPVPFACRYHVATQRFSPLSDIASARTAVAAKSEKRNAIAQSTPVPTASPKPDRRAEARNLVVGFVGSLRAGGPETVLGYYDTTVDYFDHGRVGQAFIRTDLEKYGQRWPIRQDAVVDDRIDVQELPADQGYLANYRQSFVVASQARGECIRGQFAISVNIRPAGAGMKIAGIKERVLHREKGVLRTQNGQLVALWPSETPAQAPAPTRTTPSPPNSIGTAIMTGILQGLADGLGSPANSYSAPSSGRQQRWSAPARTNRSQVRASQSARRPPPARPSSTQSSRPGGRRQEN